MPPSPPNSHKHLYAPSRSRKDLEINARAGKLSIS